MQALQKRSNTERMQVPPEVALIDACCMEDVQIRDLTRYSGHYFTTQRVLEEVERWIAKERKPSITDYDTGTGRVVERPGFVHTVDERIAVEDILADCTEDRKRKDLEYRLMELRRDDERNRHRGARFFHAVRGYNHFYDHPEQVLKTPGGVDVRFKQYMPLLTKHIIADVLKEREQYTALERGNIRHVEATCKARYRRRLAQSGLAHAVPDARKDLSMNAFGKILHRMKHKCEEGMWVSRQRQQFERSIKTDAMVVQMAYQKRFAGGDEVCVYTKDRDVDELIDYINAAKETGAMRTTNNVRCYFAAPRRQRYAA